LLDVSTASLGSISVSGELVFANTVCARFFYFFNLKNLNVTSKWIRANNGGKIIVGSSDAGCQITSKIVITLTGPRTVLSDMGSDPYDGSNFLVFFR
jgi:hypothetical protein